MSAASNDDGLRVDLNKARSRIEYSNGRFSFYEQPDLELPPLELSFRDYLLTDLAMADSSQVRESREYWWQRLETLPPAPQIQSTDFLPSQ